MAQADQTVQNDTFPTVRADINNNLAALFSNNSGATEPGSGPSAPPAVAYMDWIDTRSTNPGGYPVWRKRNATNNAWITLGTIIGNTLAFEGTLPSQSGNSGKYLTTDGTTASWGSIPPGSSKEVFTSSGTWTKPSAGTIALITIWGGGGGGGRDQGDFGGGGGGGGCVQALYQLSDLPGSAAVTIGAGGTGQASTGAGGVGGTSSFGSLLSAYGGGGGQGSSTNNTGGGGGGGSLSAGSTPPAGIGGGAGGNGHGSVLDGGNGGSTFIAPGRGNWGGGGGGGTAGNRTGAGAYYGGGGGGGCDDATQRAGGTSLLGGNGAASNTGTAGSVPGGGGGGSEQAAVAGGAGGAGLCIVYIW
jgi:hypothetical protein